MLLICLKKINSSERPNGNESFAYVFIHRFMIHFFELSLTAANAS